MIFVMIREKRDKYPDGRPSGDPWIIDIFGNASRSFSSLDEANKFIRSMITNECEFLKNRSKEVRATDNMILHSNHYGSHVIEFKAVNVSIIE